MPSEFFHNHSDLTKILLVIFIFLVGCFENIIFEQKAIPCATWFFGLLLGVVSIASFERLGVIRWIFAPLVLIIGFIFIVRYYKKANRNS
jgi:positive regulator of sigma E activity